MAIFTVQEVKSHIGIDVSTFDGQMGVVVDAIHEDMLRYTQRRFLEQTAIVGEKHVGDTRLLLVLKEFPLISVQQLKINGAVVATGSSTWEIDNVDGSILYRPSGWDLPSNAGQRNIEVDYTVGYATASGPIKQLKLAGIEWAGNRFRLRQKLEFRSEAFVDHSSTFETDMPGHVRIVLDRYVRKYG